MKKQIASITVAATLFTGGVLGATAAQATDQNPADDITQSVSNEINAPLDATEPFTVDENTPQPNQPAGEQPASIDTAASCVDDSYVPEDQPAGRSTRAKKTIAQLNEWVNDRVGKIVSDPKSGSCVALFNAYSVGFLGNTRFDMGSAKNAYAKAPSSQWTRLSASATPKKGDVAVWDGSHGGGSGHVALVLENKSSSTIRVFHQNWNHTYATKDEVSKSGLIGYLRPKKLA